MTYFTDRPPERSKERPEPKWQARYVLIMLGSSRHHRPSDIREFGQEIFFQRFVADIPYAVVTDKDTPHERSIYVEYRMPNTTKTVFDNPPTIFELFGLFLSSLSNRCICCLSFDNRRLCDDFFRGDSSGELISIREALGELGALARASTEEI